MRFWDRTDPEMAAADALPWDMPLGHAVRPLTMRTIVQITLAGTVLIGSGSAVGLFVHQTNAAASLRHPAALAGVAGYGLTLATILGVGVLVMSATFWRRCFPVVFVGAIYTSSLIVTVGVYSAGPGFGDVTTAFYIEAPLFAFYVMRLPWALGSVGLALSSYAAVLTFQDDWPQPLARWLVILTAVAATAFIMGRLAQRAEALAEAEHAARTQLDEVNRTLEERVATQVREIEKLGGLRRFLSPQVADVLLSDDSETLHRPHRARIALFFCDLRGFTAFTNRAEPEEVVAALDEYYALVGGLLQKHGATIGDYAGDGVMAYFGDPVPHPDPAGAALTMAHELAEPMAQLVAEWRRLGHALGYGVGVAYGYATIGVIGFDGRYDYTPIGGVVNLAARLCSKAGDGEVLLDHAAYAAAEDRLVCELVTELDLKGFTADTRVYRLK